MSLWCGDAGKFFDEVLFGVGDLFNKGGGDGRNGYGDDCEHGFG